MTNTMAPKKYELVPTEKISPSGAPLFQVRALRHISCRGHEFFDKPGSARGWLAMHLNHFTAREGDLGGYVEGEHNLSQAGDSWVGPGAVVTEGARVEQNAWLIGEEGRARGFALITGDALVDGAIIQDRARVERFAYVAPLQGMNGVPVIGGTRRVGGASSIHEGEHYGLIGMLKRSVAKPDRSRFLSQDFGG